MNCSTTVSSRRHDGQNTRTLFELWKYANSKVRSLRSSILECIEKLNEVTESDLDQETKESLFLETLDKILVLISIIEADSSSNIEVKSLIFFILRDEFEDYYDDIHGCINVLFQGKENEICETDVYFELLKIKSLVNKMSYNL